MEDARKQIEKNDACLDALKSMGNLLMKDDDILEKAEVLCCFLKYRQLDDKLKKRR